VTYEAFAKRVCETGIITDPWLDGQPRFAQTPVVIEASTRDQLYEVAERIASVYNELVGLVGDTPSFLDEFFGFTPTQKAMWASSVPSWHGIARADVFLTSEGPCIAELNCDTPTGQAEAVVLGELAGEGSPNGQLQARFVHMVEAIAAAELKREPSGLCIGLVYPTELTEDLALVRLFRSWLEGRGHRVVLGSPYNLAFVKPRLQLFGVPVDVVVRHYKSDWWCERAPVWSNDSIPDAAPLIAPLAAILSAIAEGTVCVVNPMAAILTQNKRAMAFMWEHIHRFSPAAQAVIQAHIPFTARMEVMHEAQLLTQKNEWVIKSDYGAEGDEVVVGRAVSLAKPRRFVAQRFFDATPVSNGEIVNYGVFLIGGKAAGIYLRTQLGSTDTRAKSVGIVVRSS